MDDVIAGNGAEFYIDFTYNADAGTAGYVGKGQTVEVFDDGGNIFLVLMVGFALQNGGSRFFCQDR